MQQVERGELLTIDWHRQRSTHKKLAQTVWGRAIAKKIVLIYGLPLKNKARS